MYQPYTNVRYESSTLMNYKIPLDIDGKSNAYKLSELE
jgi:hypothetical protein